jgi:hypothetical protein
MKELIKKVVIFIRNKRDARFKKQLERVLENNILDSRVVSRSYISSVPPDK